MKKSFVILFTILISWCSCKSQEWVKPDSLWNAFLVLGRYDSALYYANEAAAIVRGTLGENNLQYGHMLRNLAISHFYLGNFKKAKYFILREAGLRESMKKANDQDYIICLETASLICRKSGSYEEALTQIKKADMKALDIYDREGPLYAEILYYYAGVYHDFGCSVNDMVYLNQEEKNLKKAEAIYMKYGERERKEYITCMTDEAAWNNNVGNSPAAEATQLQVVEICKKEFGPESIIFASSMNNLAVLYYNSGNYKQAEKYFVDAAAVYKKSREAGGLKTAVCLNNLGALYLDMGNYKVAKNRLDESRKLFEDNSQRDNPEYAVVMNNLASVSLSEEYYASPENKSRKKLLSAGKTLMEADSVFNLNCQKPHPYNQSFKSNLAIWYNMIGDKETSTKIFTDLTYDSNITLRVVSMMSKMNMSAQLPSVKGRDSGPEPVIIPITIKLVGEISASNSQNRSTGGTDGVTNALVKLILGKANNIKKAVGPYHPAYCTMLKSLIALYSSNDDVKTEEELTLEYIKVINQRTLQDFSFLSESEKELYYQTRLPDIYSFISYSLVRKKANPQITGYTYNNILLNKGLMLKSSTAMRLAILNSNNPELLKEYDEWISLQKEISILYSTPVEMRTQDVSVLESRANALEKSLVESSQDFSDYRKGLQVTWDDVRKSLKPDEAAIEFTDFKKREKDGGDAVIYCALIVRANSQYPEMIKLFNEEQLKAVIEKSGTNNINDINDIYGSAGRQDERLYNLIWKPMEAYLNGVRNVFISPSGLLYKISFPAISNGKDVYLCDKYQIQVKGSTGNITTQNLFSQGKKPSALIFGGIQYGANKESEVWGYLKGTRDEGDAVNTILKGQVDVRYLTGNDATETFLKKYAGSYNILHIATHGFFFSDPNVVRLEDKKQDIEYGDVAFRGARGSFGVNSFVNNENPLMRSGLVLAGANDVWVKAEKGDADDGVLTAQEVTQIDLRKNDLVVLSACETGLGDIRGNEGVYGLQRALKMAGVKYIIMSLWQIPDKETVEFMGMFYNNLLTDKDIKSAFYKTQKLMRTKYDPYFWGAFVLLD